MQTTNDVLEEASKNLMNWLDETYSNDIEITQGMGGIEIRSNNGSGVIYGVSKICQWADYHNHGVYVNADPSGLPFIRIVVC